MVIACNGMVRSGSTLQYNLARGLVEGLSLGKAARCSSNGGKIEVLADSHLFYIIKSHTVLPNSKELIAEGQMGICYIYRDIRDVAVSLKHIRGISGEILFQELENAINNYYEIRSLDCVLTQRYEDVVGDLHTAVREIADYLYIKPSNELVSNIVEENSLEKALESMPKARLGRIIRRLHGDTLARKLGISEAFIQKVAGFLSLRDKNTLLLPNHISKNRGATGTWRTELTEYEIEEIHKRFGPWLKETNYIRSVRPERRRIAVAAR